MVKSADPVPDGKGFSARQLALVFLAGVAVCGVFFSLGFLVGYNERSTRMAPVTERVSSSATIPPTVNAPIATTQIETAVPAPSRNSIPPPIARAQASPPTSQPSEREPEIAASSSPPPAAPPPPATSAEKGSKSGAVEESGGAFIVQIVASKARQDAETLVKILRGRGFPAFLVSPQAAHANDDLYRVQVGPFASRIEAEKMRGKLSQEGFKPFIRH